MKYQFISEHRSEFSVQKMSQVLKVSESGYYGNIKRKPSKRAIIRIELQDKIRKTYDLHRGTAGSRTIAADLNELGVHGINKTRVSKEMKLMGLKCKTKKRFAITTNSNHNEPIAPNILNRSFTQEAPNRVWVGDITYLPVKDKWHYLSVFIDLFSRKVVGWDLSDSLHAESTINAFNKAVYTREPSQGLIVHSDRGIQYASKNFREQLEKNECVQSMSRKGNCWDNAVAEAFFSSLKKRMIHNNRKYETENELKMDLFPQITKMPKYKIFTSVRVYLFEYIEVYYNRFRKHSAINMPAHLIKN
jgi:putative transposase